jgi:WD40-like Beta Propeller Repeat
MPENSTRFASASIPVRPRLRITYVQVHGSSARDVSSRGAGVTYGLNIDLGTAFTSASCEKAGESVALQLSPATQDFPSTRFVTDGGVQVDSLAEILRGIVSTANQQLGEVPTSVRVTYPPSWASSELLRLWEALVLAGIPDAATEPASEPKPSVSVPPANHEQPPAETVLPSPRAAARSRHSRFVVAAIAAVTAGVVTGLIVTGVIPQPVPAPGDAESQAVGGAPVASEPTPATEPTSTSEPSPLAESTSTSEPFPAGGVDLPRSDPLAMQQFVVPRGGGAATQLNVANVAGMAPRRLSTTPGRNSWPMLSGDRRTVIYINYIAGTLRTMAADGSGDRSLLKSAPKGCGQITRASWSPADQSIMVVECRAISQPDRLLVIKLDGTVVRELNTGAPRIADPMLSPDGRTVAYWADDTAEGPNGGSIYTLAINGSTGPVQLTDRQAGSDADPAWSPDGDLIAFRRRVSQDNFDVYVMRSDGSGVRPVATGPAVEEKPAWSPDGRQMMIISNRDASGEPGKTYDVYVIDVSGGSIRPLGLTENVILAPVWSSR